VVERTLFETEQMGKHLGITVSMYSSIEVAVRKVILIEYDPALIIIPVSHLLNVSIHTYT